MDSNRLNLIYKLNHIVNKSDFGTVDYELAKFFLEHFKTIQNLNIFDIAEKNHVSRATVRRFSKQLGYSNFSDMKNHAKDFDDGVNLYEEFYGHRNFIPTLVTNIENLMKELSVRFNTQEIKRLVEMMNDTKEIIIITSSNIAGLVKTFQQQMIVFGKRVTLLTSKKDLNFYKRVEDKPLIIVFSITGLFVSSVMYELNTIDAQKVLFTIDRNPIYNQYFDKIYHLCSQGFSEVNELLYYTYGINFVLDLLFNEFLFELKKKNIKNKKEGT